MKPNHKAIIGVGSVLLITLISALVVRNNVRKKGYSRNEFTAKLFKVPYAPLVTGLDKKYRDLEEQKENIDTEKEIVFR